MNQLEYILSAGFSYPLDFEQLGPAVYDDSNILVGE